MKKAVAKVNIFLKIVGRENNYHKIQSRFVRYEKLYDELFFAKKQTDEEFELIGKFTCKNEDNILSKIYFLLKNIGYKQQMEEFFSVNALHVNKNIPEFAGLGGGSSDGATFLMMCNEAIKLGLDKKTLADISLKIGADLPFFIYEYKSANVSGIGEIVEEFNDDELDILVKTSDIKSSTVQVFNEFKKNNKIIKNSPYIKNWNMCSSKSLLECFDAKVLNDLYESAINLYPNLQSFYEKGYFMSGSGSAVFEVKNG